MKKNNDSKMRKNFGKRGLAFLLAVAMLSTNNLATLPINAEGTAIEAPAAVTPDTPTADAPVADSVQPSAEGVIPDASNSAPTGETGTAPVENGDVTGADQNAPAEKINLKGNIIYLDNGDIAHADINLQLFANGVLQESIKPTIESIDGIMTYTFADLSKTDESGNLISYAIKDANYDASNKTQSLYFRNSNKEIVEPNVDGLCETANVDLVYVERTSVSGDFDITMNGAAEPQLGNLILTMSTEDAADELYNETTTATLTKDEEQSKANGAPISYTWNVQDALVYNPITETAITYRGQVTSGTDGYVAYYDNSKTTDHKDATDYVYAGGLVDYVYTGESAFETEEQPEDATTNYGTTIAGQIDWSADAEWANLTRPTADWAETNAVQILKLYITSADGTTKTPYDLQGTAGQGHCYVEWTPLEGTDVWNYRIFNAPDLATGESYVINSAGFGSYGAISDTTVGADGTMQEIKPALNMGKLSVTKNVIPANDTDSFNFTVTATGIAGNTSATQNYTGAFTKESASGTIGNGKINGLKNGETVTLTEFPVGLTYKVTEDANSDYLTTYDDKILGPFRLVIQVRQQLSQT